MANYTDDSDSKLCFKFVIMNMVIGLTVLVVDRTFANDVVKNEELRLRGFSETQRERKAFDRDRESARWLQDEEYYRWELEREKGVAEYKKNKQPTRSLEGGVEHKTYLAEKKAEQKQAEIARKEYVAQTKKIDRKSFNAILTEEEEFGLKSDRPLFDYKKRCSLGFKSRWCGKTASSSSGLGGGSSGFSSGGSSFPPPPTFDDFGGDSGYVPPPNFGEGDSDFAPPPPPPPPIFPDENGFGGGVGDGDGFSPTPLPFDDSNVGP